MLFPTNSYANSWKFDFGLLPNPVKNWKGLTNLLTKSNLLVLCYACLQPDDDQKLPAITTNLERRTMDKRKFSFTIFSIFSLIFLSACGILSFTPPKLPDLSELSRLIPEIEINFSTPSPQESRIETVPTATAVERSQPAQVVQATPHAQLPLPSMVEAYQGALVDVYAHVNPSVVNIRVLQKQSNLTHPEVPGFQFPQDELPEDFFNEGVGSGFVWDQQGHIVTNNHVIVGADKVEVTFSDGVIAIAAVVGTDVYTDLAVLKVDLPEEQLQPVTLADSKQVMVGQLAVAIGNPWGLNGTMTVGIISGLERSLPAGTASTGGNYSIPDIIQTDAPINPGNSGGVLVDIQGHVVGVTAAIESPFRGNAGVGYAIPAAIVQKVVPSLIEDGAYQHPWIGFSGMPVGPELAQALGLDASQRGALVITIIPGSPAEKAGLRGGSRTVRVEGIETRVGGDVIVSIGGDSIRSMSDVIAYLARNTIVGQEVELGILREGKSMTLELTLGARPPSP
jgi:serine protease Do